MRSKNHNPTAAQRRWHDAVASLGSIISGGPAVLHHAVGATGKHNKVHIGEWWVIPLTDEEHKALHNGETFGFESRKELEKHGMRWVTARLMMDLATTGQFWPPDGVEEVIQAYHR